VRSSRDWGVTGEPEGWAGGGRASEEEGGECGSVRATAQSATPISSPPLPRSWSRRSIDWRPMQPRHCPLAWPHSSVATDNVDETPSLSLTQPQAAPVVRGHTRLSPLLVLVRSSKHTWLGIQRRKRRALVRMESG
jgi:hypothetical protein